MNEPCIVRRDSLRCTKPPIQLRHESTRFTINCSWELLLLRDRTIHGVRVEIMRAALPRLACAADYGKCLEERSNFLHFELPRWYDHVFASCRIRTRRNIRELLEQIYALYRRRLSFAVCTRHLYQKKRCVFVLRWIGRGDSATAGVYDFCLHSGCLLLS